MSELLLYQSQTRSSKYVAAARQIAGSPSIAQARMRKLHADQT
jgi:hypothetical protein